jgi:hypothetical protein
MLLVAGLSGAAAEETVTTLDARTLTGKVVSIDAKTVVLADSAGKEQKLSKIARKDVSQVVLGTWKNLLDQAGQIVVETNAGDCLWAETLGLKDGCILLKNFALGELSLKMNQVKVIVLPGPGRLPKQVLDGCSERKYGTGSRDLLVIEPKDGKWRSAKGVLVGIGPEKITFRYKNEDREISRRSARAIWLSETTEKLPKTIGSLVCRDGSTLKFSAIRLAGQNATVTSPAAGQIVVARKNIAAIHFKSDRLVRLADLKPEKVTEYGFLSTGFPYRQNRSVASGPLRLDGKTYRTGLGLHSFCELTYDLGGAYSSFVATVGIDDAIRPAGNAELTIIADGKPLLPATKLTGKDKARTIRLNIKGVRKLTIRVTFGEDKLDVGDHVDLAGARLVK